MSEISEEATRLIDEFEYAVEDAISDYTMACGASYKNQARHNLEDYIAELEDAQRWHVVDDGDLPIFGKSIMFYDSSSEEIYRGVYTASHHWRANYFNKKCGTVAHWMPLPQLPEVQE